MNPQKPLSQEQPKFIGKMLERAEKRKQQRSKDSAEPGQAAEKSRQEPEVIMTASYRRRLEEMQRDSVNKE